MATRCAPPPPGWATRSATRSTSPRARRRRWPARRGSGSSGRSRAPESRGKTADDHVAHGGARSRDSGRLSVSAARLEGKDLVLPGLVIPGAPVGADRDAVGLAVAAAGTRKLPYLSGRWIEPAELAARVVRIPHDAVRVDRETARPRRGIGERVLP